MYVWQRLAREVGGGAVRGGTLAIIGIHLEAVRQ